MLCIVHSRLLVNKAVVSVKSLSLASVYGIPLSCAQIEKAIGWDRVSCEVTIPSELIACVFTDSEREDLVNMHSRNRLLSGEITSSDYQPKFARMRHQQSLPDNEPICKGQTFEALSFTLHSVFVLQKVYIDHGSLIVGSMLAFGKASTMMRLTFKFHYP